MFPKTIKIYIKVFMKHQAFSTIIARAIYWVKKNESRDVNFIRN